MRVMLQHRIPMRQPIALTDFALADIVEQLDAMEREALAVIKTVAGPEGVGQDDEAALLPGALDGLLQRQALIDPFELTQADDMEFDAACIRAV